MVAAARSDRQARPALIRSVLWQSDAALGLGRELPIRAKYTFMISPAVKSSDSLRQRYEKHYTEAVGAFLRDVSDINPTGIPEIHLPLWGNGYETADLRIAFIGRDTRGWGDMAAFLDAARSDIKTAIFRSESEFLELPFTRWTNNFGTSFWDTVMRFLAAFYGISDWKTLKRREHDTILQKFVWANTNAVEQWGVTAAHNNADYNSWARLKTASEVHLDSFVSIRDVFQPHVAIVMHWEAPSRYWGCDLQWQRIGAYANYAFDDSHNVHIFHTAHPTWLNLNRLRPAVLETICAKWVIVS